MRPVVVIVVVVVVVVVVTVIIIIIIIIIKGIYRAQDHPGATNACLEGTQWKSGQLLTTPTVTHGGIRHQAISCC